MSAVLNSAASLAHVRAVLFDLDGTLIDSAPDLAGAANEMRIERGLDPLPYEALRPMVGSGARGMLGRALDIAPGHADFELLRADFLDRYEHRMLRLTAVFEAVQPVLHALSTAAMPWAIVTNKAERFALPMTRALGLFEQAGAVIGGDTTPHAKPHPGPLLEAARRLGIAPELCVYIGDDERDVQAGRAAGMATVAAGWGYLGQGAGVEAWGADIVINEPAQLLKELVLP
ncbi:phosphoglycolate phosphatase [Paucibacter sp. O1-1]|nr:phosphoglycolate phosphatase [Paucibacter sp. O1-1]MDA3827790.1 phosphoglycolate phosphatase [Paucibacter sp. O1-1]